MGNQTVSALNHLGIELQASDQQSLGRTFKLFDKTICLKFGKDEIK